MVELLAADDAAIRMAVTFHASFDEKPAGDFGAGDLRLWTRADDPAEKGKKLMRAGHDSDRIRVVPGAGISGGALEFRALSPDNAFVFFPARGKLAVKQGGWGGAVSLWVKADVAKVPEKSPWDPFLLVQKGWNNGSVWCDFAPGTPPRELRIGLFPTLAEGKPLPSLEEGEKIWLRAQAPQFKANTWHHLAQVWDNFDTGKADAWTACYLDGQLMGKIEGRDGTMSWDADAVRFHIGSGLIGFMDEVALFGRPLTAVEVMRLQEAPAVLRGPR
jgi:hypothetical protein